MKQLFLGMLLLIPITCSAMIRLAVCSTRALTMRPERTSLIPMSAQYSPEKEKKEEHYSQQEEKLEKKRTFCAQKYQKAQQEESEVKQQLERVKNTLDKKTEERRTAEEQWYRADRDLKRLREE